MEKYKIVDIIDFFFQIEKKYDLIEHKIDEIYFWKIIRFSLFLQVSTIIGFYDIAHPVPSRTVISKIYDMIKKEIIKLRYDALRGNKRYKALIFQHPRKMEIDGEYVDIYTNKLIQELNITNPKEIQVIDKLSPFQNYYPANNKKAIIKISISKRFKSKTTKINYLKKDIELINQVEEEIINKFHINIDLKKVVNENLINFTIDFKYYLKLFNKRKPNKIYLVISYGSEAIIAAAKNNGIEVIEIQHGTMSKYHLGYSFPYNHDVPYFPDKLWLFGKYWSDITPLPLDQKNIIYYGYPYLDMQLKKFSNIKKLKNKIIFLSQGTIASYLIKIAYDFANENKQYFVEYKLHPSEYKVWKQKYPYLVEANKLENFSVIENNEKNLYHLLAESDFQVGVNSTVIYEGLSLGLKTFLINLPGIEIMDYLINTNLVKLVNNAKELKAAIQDNFNFNIERDYIFKGNN